MKRRQKQKPDVPIPPHPGRERIDHLLVERGLVDTGEKARRMIMAGLVTVAGQIVDKPGSTVLLDAPLEIKGALPYVSRGGWKLEAALDAFAVDPAGMVAADFGASTGGFVDCLLQRGAARVYAIDVGYGQLAWSLRQDARVVVMERINVRYLEGLPEPIDLVVVDVSFISLQLVLPVAQRLLRPAGQIVALIKPQFEAGRQSVGKGGVVRDPAVHRRVLLETLTWGRAHGLGAVGLIPSPIRGPAGNVEFLAGWRPVASGSNDDSEARLAELIESAMMAIETYSPKE
jgi:23S rRNA (cytidine1920-2'-O)/16S rRNA (cytidine1409-2'-O)-methyltransferase